MMKRIVTILLLMPLLLLSAVSCNRETAPRQRGISLIEGAQTPYREETTAEALRTVTSLLRAAAGKIGTSGQSFAERIDALAVDLEAAFRAEGIPEDRYLAFFEELGRREDAYSDLFAAVALGTDADPDTARELIRQVFSSFGSSALSGLLRGILDAKYDYEIRQNESRAETYVNMPAVAERYVLRAEDFRRKKAVLAGIDGEEFSAVARVLALALGTVSVSGEGLPDADLFTDAEWSSVIRNVRIDVELSADEWEILLEEGGAVPAVGDFYDAVLLSSDQEEFARLMNGLSALLSEAKNGITPEVAAELRDAGGESEICGILYRSLSERGLELLDRLSAVRFRGEHYTLFLNTNPDAADLLGGVTYTPEDLKTCGEDGYLTVFRGILRGMFYD